MEIHEILFFGFMGLIYFTSFGLLIYSRFFYKPKDEKIEIEEINHDLVQDSNLKESYALHVAIMNEYIEEWFRLNIVQTFSAKNYEATEAEFKKFKRDCINEYCERYLSSNLVTYIIKNIYADEKAFIKTIASRFDDIWYIAYKNIRNNT